MKPFYHQIFATNEEFPVRVRWSCGRTSKTMPLAYHAEPEFHFIERGQGAFLIQNRVYEFQQNSLILIHPNDVHRLLPSDAYIEEGTVMFAGALLQKPFYEELCRKDFPRYWQLTAKEATEIEVLINQIGAEKSGQQEYWCDIIRMDLYRFVLMVKRLNRRTAPPPTVNPAISRVISHIDQHITDDLTLAALATVAHYSPFYLSRQFKQFTGLGVRQYILQRRVLEAKKLLTDPAAPKITLIPAQIGFREYCVFARIFKSVTGLTPTAYRRQAVPAKAG